MIKAVLFDFSRVFLFYKDGEYIGSLGDKSKALQAAANEYQFLEHFYLNEELLNFAKEIKERGIGIYIYTNGILHRMEEIKRRIQPIFPKIYEGGIAELPKSASASYKFIADDLGITTQELLFLDDKEKNVRAAAEAGVTAIQFHNNDQAIEQLKQNLN